MKVRLGFVTNSSSSSFIISYQKAPDMGDKALKDMMTLLGADAVIENEEEVKKYFMDEYGMDEEDFNNDEWSVFAKEAIAAGKIIIIKSIGYGGEDDEGEALLDRIKGNGAFDYRGEW